MKTTASKLKTLLNNYHYTIKSIEHVTREITIQIPWTAGKPSPSFDFPDYLEGFERYYEKKLSLLYMGTAF